MWGSGRPHRDTRGGSAWIQGGSQPRGAGEQRGRVPIGPHAEYGHIKGPRNLGEPLPSHIGPEKGRRCRIFEPYQSSGRRFLTQQLLPDQSLVAPRIGGVNPALIRQRNDYSAPIELLPSQLPEEPNRRVSAGDQKRRATATGNRACEPNRDLDSEGAGQCVGVGKALHRSVRFHHGSPLHCVATQTRSTDRQVAPIADSSADMTQTWRRHPLDDGIDIHEHASGRPAQPRPILSSNGGLPVSLLGSIRPDFSPSPMSSDTPQTIAESTPSFDGSVAAGVSDAGTSVEPCDRRQRTRGPCVRRGSPSIARTSAPALRVEPLLELALRSSGRSDFTSRSFEPALKRLVAACNDEASLNSLGVVALRHDVLRCLRNLLRFDELEESSPALLAAPVRAPVFITGMPRSGTTFLHRLIVQDRTTIAPRLFHLVHPDASHSGYIGSSLRKAAVRLQLRLFRLIAPEFHALHPLGVDEPEECTDIIAQVFHSSRFESSYRVPSYSAWLHATGFLDAYRFHRRFLQHLQAHRPERRWVLKSPDHVFALDEVRAVYPDARLIVIHRDPVRVLASVARLTQVMRKPFTRRNDPLEIGKEVTASWIEGARRMSALPADDRSILHLHYRWVVSHPLDAIDAVFRHCGLKLSQEAEYRMFRWLNRSRQVHRASGRYDLAHFGLDPRRLREQFTHYTDRFRVEIEPD
jgi:Sulfotransferase family